MSRSFHLPSALALAIAVALGATAGCGGGSTPPPGKVEEPGLHAVQYFKDHQGPTQTPHGAINLESVSSKDRKLEYATRDGRRWRVAYTKLGDGKYTYGTPEEVK